MKFVKIKSIIYKIMSLLMSFIPNKPGTNLFQRCWNALTYSSLGCVQPYRI